MLPNKYRQLTTSYAVISCAIGWSSGLIYCLVSYVAIDYQKMVPGCALATAMNTYSFSFWNRSCIVLTTVMAVLYAVIFCRMRVMGRQTCESKFLRYRQTKYLYWIIYTGGSNSLPLDPESTRGTSKKKTAQSKRTQHLMTSLVILSFIYFFGGLTRQLIMFLVAKISDSPPVVFHVRLYFGGILSAINVSADFFVYYWRSPEYRQHFNDILKCRWILFLRCSDLCFMSCTCIINCEIHWKSMNLIFSFLSIYVTY